MFDFSKVYGEQGHFNLPRNSGRKVFEYNLNEFGPFIVKGK